MTGSRLGSGADSKDRPALSGDRVRDILREETIEIVWGKILKMIGSFKTAMVEYFVERHADIAETVAAAALAAVTMAGRGAGRAF